METQFIFLTIQSDFPESSLGATITLFREASISITCKGTAHAMPNPLRCPIVKC